MSISDLQSAIETAWDNREDLTPATTGANREAVETALAQLDSGAARVAIDWRHHKGKSYVTPVKNQGAFGTCWSFGVAENLEGLNVRQGHPLVNISEQEFISCCNSCQGHKAEDSFVWLANNTGGQPALEVVEERPGLACVGALCGGGAMRAEAGAAAA